MDFFNTQPLPLEVTQQWSASVGAEAWVGGFLVTLGLWFGVRAWLAADERARVAWALAISAAAALAVWAYDLPMHDGDEPENFADMVAASLHFLHQNTFTHTALFANLCGVLDAFWSAASAQLHGTDLRTELCGLVQDGFHPWLGISRTVSALAWMACVVQVARLAAQPPAPLWVWLAAGLATATGVFYATAHSPYALAVLLTYLALAQALRGSPTRPRDALLTGLFWGAAIGTHGLAVIAGPPLAWFVVRGHPGRRALALCLAVGVAAAVALVLSNFWVLLDPQAYLSVVRYRLRELVAPEFVQIADHTPFFYFGVLFRSPLIVAGLLATAWTLVRVPAPRWTRLPAGVRDLLLFALGEFVLLSLFRTRFRRYLLYAWPALAFVAGWGLATAARSLAPRRRQLAVLLCAVVFASTLWESIISASSHLPWLDLPAMLVRVGYAVR